MAEKASLRKRYILIAAGVLLIGIAAGIFLFYSNKDSGNEPDLSDGHSAELNSKKMASGTAQFADGSQVAVELWLKDGIYYDVDSDDYLPSIYTYDRNYEGVYELLTVNENGDILFRIDLKDLWSDAGSTFNFSGEFELEWTDYNADGCLDFSIGMPYSSSNMGFLLFTVREDGSLERLSKEDILLNSFEKFSVVFEHDSNADGMPITGYVYNNTIGEVESVVYYYNEDSGLYEER